MKFRKISCSFFIFVLALFISCTFNEAFSITYAYYSTSSVIKASYGGRYEDQKFKLIIITKDGVETTHDFCDVNVDSYSKTLLFKFEVTIPLDAKAKLALLDCNGNIVSTMTVRAG